jgi:prephenate dehydrogenase
MTAPRTTATTAEADAPPPGRAGRILVVGTGLIGTSVGLAARAGGYHVYLADTDETRLAVAESLGAGERRPAHLTEIDLAVAAVPPASVATVVDGVIRSGLAATVTHVCSVQLQPQREVEALHPAFAGFVGSHPIAGRERSGPHHASADLFRERPWVVCPTGHSAPQSVAAVAALARACGAVVSEMPGEAHDAVLARLSHSPQLIASALAGSVLGLGRDELALAGTGLRDTSRIADSDPALWAEIVAANPAAVASALAAVTEPLVALQEALRSGDRVAEHVLALIERGRAGRSLLAGKHGQAAVRWATVSVVVPDEPGRLARLLADAADGGVNVEDIRVDHSPGQPLGIVELDVAPGMAERLREGLERRGWRASATEPLAD